MRKAIAVSAALVLAMVTAARVWADDWSQEAKLVPATGQGGDMGWSVAQSGGMAILGAPAESGYSGAAYVFGKESGGWGQVARLQAADGTSHFGWSVDIDGSTAVVGARYSSSAYVFENTGGGWVQVAKLQPSDSPSNSHFGCAVALSGSTILVGAPGCNSWRGSVYAFEKTGSAWTGVGKLGASDAAANDIFGWSVAIDGSTAIIGAYGENENGSAAGAAYIFKHPGSDWTQNAKLLAADGADNNEFGYSVSIDGSRAIVGAPENKDNGYNAGAAYIFEDAGSGWTQKAKLLAADGDGWEYFGHSASISGSMVLVGAQGADDYGENSGAAYVFRDTGSGWEQAAKLLASDGSSYALFGQSVSLGGSGAIIGAPDAGAYGAGYVFTPEPATLLMLGFGALGILSRRRARRKDK